MKPPLPAAILVRVSPDTEAHLKELRATAKRKRWTIVATIHERPQQDPTTRPGLEKAMELARTGTIRVLLTHGTTGHALFRTLREAGVHLHDQVHASLIAAGLRKRREQGEHLGRPFGTATPLKSFLKTHAGIVRMIHNGGSVRKTARKANRSKGLVEKVRRELGLTQRKDYEV